MKEIGGYFELELPEKRDRFLHSDGCLVNSGRHALEYILRSLGDTVKKVWLPYYTCDVVLQPLNRLGIGYSFYHINLNFELTSCPKLDDGEYIIVNNYFGIKDSYITKLAELYGERLIVDNAQAWYAPVLPDIKSFYSPRKFFGVPDGGVAFTDEIVNSRLAQDFSARRCSHLLKRIDENAGAGYADFRANSFVLSNEPLKFMSKLTSALLSTVNMETVKRKRRRNYGILAEALGNDNLLRLPNEISFNCPMVYPYMHLNVELRKRLIDHKVFVATYWPNVKEWCKNDSVEFMMTSNILPLPIDQRYNEEDMDNIINIIRKYGSQNKAINC